MKHLVSTAAAVVSIAVLVPIAGCTYVVSGYERAFERTSDGDSMLEVVSRFGAPSVRERQSTPFDRYVAKPCEAPCAERLWWEHPVLRGIEAWCVEFDVSGRVVHKAHLVSP